MIAADVLRALGWEVEINEKDSYWNLVLTNTTSSMDMPESHKSCLRGLLRGWLMEFNYEGGRQQVNIYKDLHGLDPRTTAIPAWTPVPIGRTAIRLSPS